MYDIIIVYAGRWTEEAGVHTCVQIGFDFADDVYWQWIDLETIGM